MSDRSSQVENMGRAHRAAAGERAALHPVQETMHAVGDFSIGYSRSRADLAAVRADWHRSAAMRMQAEAKRIVQ